MEKIKKVTLNIDTSYNDELDPAYLTTESSGSDLQDTSEEDI